MKFRYALATATLVVILPILGACNTDTGPGGGMNGHGGGMGDHMGGSGSSAGGSELTDVPASAPKLEFTAREFSYSPSSNTAKPGATVIELTNKGSIIHDFTIDGIGVHVAANAGQSTNAAYALKTGTYEFYCTVPGHKAAGMAGTLTVS